LKNRRIIKDKIKRSLFFKNEIFQRVLKLLFFFKNNLGINIVISYVYVTFSLKNILRNTCIMTGRSRGIYKKFKVSRFFFRELGSQGFFFGLQKVSW
jgi:ribosomal protein S14